MVKVISISDNVYSELEKMKNGASFSKFIESLIEKAKKRGDIANMERFIGILTGEEAADWKKEIKERRRSAKARMFR